MKEIAIACRAAVFQGRRRLRLLRLTLEIPHTKAVAVFQLATSSVYRLLSTAFKLDLVTSPPSTRTLFRIVFRAHGGQPLHECLTIRATASSRLANAEKAKSCTDNSMYAHLFAECAKYTSGRDEARGASDSDTSST